MLSRCYHLCYSLCRRGQQTPLCQQYRQSQAQQQVSLHMHTHLLLISTRVQADTTKPALWQADSCHHMLQNCQQRQPQYHFSCMHVHAVPCACDAWAVQSNKCNSNRCIVQLPVAPPAAALYRNKSQYSQSATRHSVAVQNYSSNTASQGRPSVQSLAIWLLFDYTMAGKDCVPVQGNLRTLATAAFQLFTRPVQL